MEWSLAFSVESSESCSVISNSLRPHGLYSSWNSPGRNTGVGSHSLLQGIFLTQGSNPGLPHCRRILYQLSHQGSPRILEWVTYPFSSKSSQPRNQTGVSCIASGFFTSWAKGQVFGVGLESCVCVCVCVCVCAYSVTQSCLFMTTWTIAHQAPLSMGFPRQEHWSGLPFPPPGDLPSPGIKPESLVSPALAGRFFTLCHMGSHGALKYIHLNPGISLKVARCPQPSWEMSRRQSHTPAILHAHDVYRNPKWLSPSSVIVEAL